jgi:hypothetical protein
MLEGSCAGPRKVEVWALQSKQPIPHKEEEIMVEIHETAADALISAEINRTAAVIIAGTIVTTTQDSLERLRKRGVECRYILPAGPLRSEQIQLHSTEGTSREKRIE